MQKFTTFIGRLALAMAITSIPVAVAAQTNSKPSDPSATMKPGSASPRPSNSGLSAADQKFVREAVQGGMAEVELGKLATEKASNEAVKKFGQRMVDDHTQAGEQLKAIAGSKGIEVPEKLSAKDQMTKDRLSKLSGEQFDKVYMNDMVKDHTQDVADFRRESTSGRDSDVKGFAAKTLPTLKEHLRQAKSLAPANGSAGNNMKESK